MKTCLFQQNIDDCIQRKGRSELELHESFVHFFLIESCIFLEKRRISSCISFPSDLLCHNKRWQCCKNKQKNIPFGLKFIQIEKLVHQFLIWHLTLLFQTRNGQQSIKINIRWHFKSRENLHRYSFYNLLDH